MDEEFEFFIRDSFIPHDYYFIIVDEEKKANVILFIMEFLTSKIKPTEEIRLDPVRNWFIRPDLWIMAVG
jgi:hypothetical protein